MCFCLVSMAIQTTNSTWINTCSLALAFIVSYSLAATIGTAFAQRVWQSSSANDRGYSISTIDSLFGVQTKPLNLPLNLLVFGMWRSAFIASILALAFWLMPLVAVISHTTLSVEVALRNVTDHNCLVHGLDLDLDWPESGPEINTWQWDDRFGDKDRRHFLHGILAGWSTRSVEQGSDLRGCHHVGQTAAMKFLSSSGLALL